MTSTNFAGLRQLAPIRLTLRTRSTPGRLRHARSRPALPSKASLSRRLSV